MNAILPTIFYKISRTSNLFQIYFLLLAHVLNILQFCFQLEEVLQSNLKSGDLITGGRKNNRVEKKLKIYKNKQVVFLMKVVYVIKYHLRTHFHKARDYEN